MLRNKGCDGSRGSEKALWSHILSQGLGLLYRNGTTLILGINARERSALQGYSIVQLVNAM
jgi:hypothetical protein